MNIITNSNDTDDLVVGAFVGYIVDVCERTILVTGAGRDSQGFTTIEGVEVLEEHDHLPQPNATTLAFTVTDDLTVVVY
jgi:hypothetical protein